jgi:hypothetical protein
MYLSSDWLKVHASKKLGDEKVSLCVPTRCMSQLIHNFFIQYFSKKNCTPPDTDNLIYLHHMYIYTYECMYVCMYVYMNACMYI